MWWCYFPIHWRWSNRMSIAKMKSRKHRDPLFAIVISVIVASILMVYPLSYTLSGWRPLFMLMVMLFWVLCQSTWCGIWFAFGTGIFIDLLLDVSLGLNLIRFIFITFIASFLSRDLRILTFNKHWVNSLMTIVELLLIIFFEQFVAGVYFSFAPKWITKLISILV